jgi:tRNA threonylcarbamoyladenosine biosynthesis protein TsaB
MHLIIDTSTERAIIVMAHLEKVLFVHRFPVGYQGSRTLFSEIERGLLELNIKISDIRGVAVTTGPGLFTGIRIGMAAAKGIAYGRQIPLVGMNSLLGFISPEEGRFYSAIDGRSQGIHVLLQERKENNIITLGENQLLPREEVAITGLPVVGPCFQRLSCKYFFETYPDPQQLATTALFSFEKGNRVAL